MRYMMFIKHTEDYRMEEVPQSLFDAMGEFVGEAMKNGSIIDTAGLQLIQAKSDDEALVLAKRFMDLHRIHWPKFEGECEVRPLESFEPPK
jgi:hypothetical protein